MDPFTANRLAITIYTERLQEAETARRRFAQRSTAPTSTTASSLRPVRGGWRALLAHLSGRLRLASLRP